MSFRIGNRRFQQNDEDPKSIKADIHTPDKPCEVDKPHKKPHHHKHLETATHDHHRRHRGDVGDAKIEIGIHGDKVSVHQNNTEINTSQNRHVHHKV